MLCRMCDERFTCKTLCLKAEEYVNQDYVGLKELRIDDYSIFFFSRIKGRGSVENKWNEDKLYDVLPYESTPPACQPLEYIENLKNVKMPKRQWECVKLFYLDGLDINEISYMLNIRPITVKVLRLRGIKCLAKHFNVAYRRLRTFKSSKQSLRKQKYKLSNFK